MTTAESSCSDERSLEDVKRHQMDRLDEMQKLDGDVIGLNSAYIDILERITNKLDLLATLADEIETDTRAHPDSMDDNLKKRFDLLSQSALMNRYMCSKAIFQNAIGAIQAMNQFGCDYINDGIIRAPFQPSTSDSTENISQARHSDVTGATIASDSDATVAARLDDSNLSVMDEEAAINMDQADFIPPQSIHAPSTLLLEQEDMEMQEAREGENKISGGCFKEDELMEEVHMEIPKDPIECEKVAVLADSERSIEYGRDCDGLDSIADSIKSIESIGNEEQKKIKKKKKKRSKSSDQRRRCKEAEKMENILNKHLKRSRETKPKKSKNETQKDEAPKISPLKDIEIVTLSDDDPTRPVKISRVDDGDMFATPTKSRVIPGPKTPPMEEYENYLMEIKAIKEAKSEVGKTTSSVSNQVLATIVYPPNTTSIPNPVSSSIPNPVPSPILPPSLGTGPGFIAATMQEAPPTPSNWSQLNAERLATSDPDMSLSDKSMIIERPESRIDVDKEGESEKKEEKIRKDSRCESRGSLKERLEEEIKLRESGRFSPERRGRSLSYSPRRERSRSRGRSRSRSNSRDRDRRDWRSPWASNRFRYGYRPRYRRWSRSRTRSRSLSRTRYRSTSRDRDDWRRSRSRDRDDYRRSRSPRNRSGSRDRYDMRYRSISRSRSRSWSRSRSMSRDRSITPLTPDGREVRSPIPRAYARCRNRSSERKEKKKEEKGNGKDNEIRIEETVETVETVPSPAMEMIERRVSTPLTPSSSILVPPPTPPIIQSPRDHSSSSSPSTFIPPSPIVVPSKPPPLKICIPSTLHIPVKSGKKGSIQRAISSVQSTPSSSSTSLITNTCDIPPPPPPPPPPIVDTDEKRNDAAKRTVSSIVMTSSDMSLEGNTISEGSNGRSKSVKSGEEIILDIPTPPLSNPSAMEQKKWVEGDQLHGHLPSSSSVPPLPPIPPFPQPPLPTTNRSMDISPLSEPNATRVPSSSSLSVCTPSGTQSTMGGIRPSSGRSSGPYPLHSYQSQQFYPNATTHNPYGPQNGWMNPESQWQQYYHGYNQDPGMMGGYCGPPTPLHPSPVSQGPGSETHGSFMQAMRVIPSPINPPPDWAQMAREHANQQMHLSNVPPPPPLLGQHGHMMGHHHHYGTPQSGRGGSRFRGGGGKARRW